MQHPLVNPSLAPYGFVVPYSRKRLEYKSQTSGWVNCERVILQHWAQRHRVDAPSPLPIETIIHEILPAQRTSLRLTEGDLTFRGLPYLSMDILMLSTMVQWFGTNCGECFLDSTMGVDRMPGFHPEREYVMKLEQERERGTDVVMRITHICTKRCEMTRSMSRTWECYTHPDDVLERDRAVVDGLMRWLGRRSGRQFMERYREIRERKHRAAMQQTFNSAIAAS